MSAPLVVGIDDLKLDGAQRQYYLWFFGYVAKLPHERELPNRLNESEMKKLRRVQMMEQMLEEAERAFKEWLEIETRGSDASRK